MEYLGLIILLVIFLSMLSSLIKVMHDVDKVTNREELITDDEITHLFVRYTVVIAVGTFVLIGIILFIKYLLH